MKKFGLLIILLFGFYSEANASDNKFLSVHYEYHHSSYHNYTDNKYRVSLWGANYGHNILSQSTYYGFFSTGTKFFVYFGNENLNEMFGIFFNLRYGYEFMRDYVVSFGLETSLSIGLTLSTGYIDNNKGVIAGRLGIFGRWKATENFSILVQTGLSQAGHPETKIKDMVKNKRFGPYAAVELRSYL